MAQQTAARGSRKELRKGRRNVSRFFPSAYRAQMLFSHTLRLGHIRYAALTVAAFFALAGARLPGDIYPFAAAAFAACAAHTLYVPAAFVGCALAAGVHLLSDNCLQWWQVSACAAVWLSVPLWKEREHMLRGAMTACGVACALPALPLLTVSFTQAVACVCAAAVSVVMVPVFEKVALAVEDSKRISGEDDALCMMLALAALLMGAWPAGLVGRLVCGVFSGALVTACALLGAGGMAVVCGAALGGILYLSGGEIYLPVLFTGALLSVVPGCKNERMRAALFIPGALLGAALFSSQRIDYFRALPAIAGCVCALRFRTAVVERLSRLCPEAVTRLSVQPGAASVRTAVTLRLWSDQVRKIVQQLPQMSCVAFEELEDVQNLAQKLCDGCERKEACWNDRFEITRKYMIRLLGAAQGAEPAKVIEQARLLGCVNIGALEQILVKMQCQTTLRREEEARLTERRKLISAQIEGMADVLGNLAEHFYTQVVPDDRIYARARDELKRRRIEADVLYAVRVWERKEIMMIRRGNATAEELKRVADIACGVPMQPSAYETLANTEVLFEQAARLEVEISALCRKKDGEDVAGDGYIARPLSGGRYLIALSDGMGSGEQAHRESQATLHLLWQCLCAGYSRSQALTAVNGILLSCSSTEMFATMDLCLIDLHTGEAAFEKLGACTSYVLRNGECRAVCADTLPMGVLSSVEPRSTRMRLKEDDILVMVSDGVMDSYPDGETGLKKTLIKARTATPRSVCDAVLGRALHLRGGKAEDDMTVLCVRVKAGQGAW